MKSLDRLFVLVLIACWIDSVCAEQQDIAKGRKYTLDPKPNYRYCTDRGDEIQLTDGVYTEGYFWTQAGTVGWSGVNPAWANFDYASALNEFLMLGNVATQVEGRIEFDPVAMKIVNDTQANVLLRPEYRQGWSL